MKTRVISGILMAPLALVLYFRGYALLVACAIIGFIGVKEFFNGWEALGVKPSKTIAYIATAVLYVFAFLGLHTSEFNMFWIVLFTVVAMMYGWKITDRGPYDAMATVLGIVYVVFFSYHMHLIDTTNYGILVWIVCIAAFGSDIMAYFTGYLIGKHKLCPNLSPKKTIEGAVGGIIGAGLFSGLFGFFFCKEIFIHTIILGVIGGAVSQAGDLTASAFKRKMGIKDYGNLIPGHGGIMDRFDSVIFVAPFIYYYIIIVFPLMGM